MTAGQAPARLLWRPIGETKWREGNEIYAGGDDHARREARSRFRPGLEFKTTTNQKVEKIPGGNPSAGLELAQRAGTKEVTS